MPHFITEDVIEQAILQKLGKPVFGYEVIVCESDSAAREVLPDGTGRAVKTEGMFG